jgi:hypothetical protein
MMGTVTSAHQKFEGSQQMAKGIILEYNGCPRWRVVKEDTGLYLHCPTTQVRIPMMFTKPLPSGAEFVEGDTDLPTGTETVAVADVTV